nr:kinesin-like protein KIN-14U [Ipomoea batatas]GMD25353.1 kinesin-like protein KIN-14U [Ipomoea batatas]GME17870.1 kinesin-like protein KIN-14U [Ipomoea batatas]
MDGSLFRRSKRRRASSTHLHMGFFFLLFSGVCVCWGEEVVKSPLMESNLGSTNGMPEASEVSPATSIDVNVVPEDDKHKLEQRILTLEGEIVNLRLKQRSLDEKRREALNKIIDIKGCIRLFCRVRPCLPTNMRRNHQPLSVESERIMKLQFSFCRVCVRGSESVQTYEMKMAGFKMWFKLVQRKAVDEIGLGDILNLHVEDIPKRMGWCLHAVDNFMLSLYFSD